VTPHRFIVGNWKLHKTPEEANQFVQALCHGKTLSGSVDIGLAPPFVAIPAVREALGQHSPILLGAQNLFWEDEGAFTGEVSAPMLRDLGCRFVIVGHSERRRIFMESDYFINKKVQAALTHGIHPILCVGETLEERDCGQTHTRIEAQIRGGLTGIASQKISEVIIAYEPVWAIGTGRSATVQQAEEIHAFIRGILTATWHVPSETLRILYGGSMSPDNAGELFRSTEINGGLVGKACLDPESFAKICYLAGTSQS